MSCSSLLYWDTVRCGMDYETDQLSYVTSFMATFKSTYKRGKNDNICMDSNPLTSHQVLLKQHSTRPQRRAPPNQMGGGGSDSSGLCAVLHSAASRPSATEDPLCHCHHAAWSRVSRLQEKERSFSHYLLGSGSRIDIKLG